MPEALQTTVTGLLLRWSAGDGSARESLLPLVYGELQRLARMMLAGERPNHTMQATDLVHELYLRLVDQRQVSLKDRRHFFGVAARTMRRVLVDHARRRKAQKRGSGLVGEAEALEVEPSWAPKVDMLALDLALEELERADPRKCHVVELRWLAGFTTEETADILELSPATVERDWKFARAWLGRAMQAPSSGEPGER